jgi:glycosyltransferase involved in cell wall biosynthesis
MNKEGYIPKGERKNILLLCDDIRMHSGVATMAREIVVGTAHRYNWFNVGAAIQHPEVGKIIDISEDANKIAMLTDADIKVMPNNGYGDTSLLRKLLKQFKFDGIFIFTDPRYWEWLFQIEREVRTKIPIMYLNIWDDYPTPLYNKQFYRSVDALLAISKQTKNINELILGAEASSKVIEYVPHGINQDHFFPIGEDHHMFTALQEFKKNVIPVKDLEFLVFFNSRNIHRKRPGDTILAYKMFCDMIGEENAKKCALVMHTEAVSEHGTDLRAVKEALAPDENIFFSQEKITPPQMNMLYNLADVTMLLSSNEGWGLSLTESMMAGTMIIGNVTGGMQDQMRFEHEGKWIDFTPDFPSNHRGTVKQCGDWAIPVFPNNISLAGSPKTPYIFDDRCAPEDAAQALLKLFEMKPEERKANGLKGREWVTSDESGMSAQNMCKKVISTVEKTFDTFTPRTKYDILKVEEYKSESIKHKLIGY